LGAVVPVHIIKRSYLTLTTPDVKCLDLDIARITAGKRTFEKETGWTLRKKRNFFPLYRKLKAFSSDYLGLFPVSIIPSIVILIFILILILSEGEVGEPSDKEIFFHVLAIARMISHCSSLQMVHISTNT
jgi:hypothetical protein